MPIVYVICPDLATPYGGVMKLYELVDTLNANHIESFIIHDDKNFKVTWFHHSTRITDFKSIQVEKDDLLIFPENYGRIILHFYPGVKKIIFNQNTFYALLPFEDLEYAKKVYLHPDIVQIIVVSDHDFNFMKSLFPMAKLSRITLGINEKLFYYNTQKKKQIAVIPRKATEDYNLLSQLLALREDLGEYTIKIIDQVSIEQCAEILRESEIFLSFSYKESFGLPPAEAMACGCIVIGYHGQGGKEFFKEGLTYAIEPADILTYANCIKNVIEQFNDHPIGIKETGRKASQFILKKYSLAEQERSILATIKPFL